MTSYLNRELIKRYDLSVGSFFFYKNHIVAEVKVGIVFTFENAAEVLKLCKTYYSNTTPFVYISNRVNSYAFNPTAHFKTTSLFPNLRGYAIVTYDSISHDIAEMEKKFLNKPVRLFSSLEDTIVWVEELIVMD